MIPYARQSINEEDIRAVVEVLRSDWLTQGPAVEQFEQAVADYCGARYAVAVSNATSALHIACLAAGLGEGDSLWTSPNTFVASANCGLYCGAEVDFVDIDPQTYNLSVQRLKEKLERAKAQNRLPKILIPVHFSGQACQMAEISDLAGRYGVTIIEDASHAIGGAYRGVRIGACNHSAMTVFSFHPVKIITTGEGGMVLTNRQDLYQKLKLLRSHGITSDPGLMRHPQDGVWFYEQIALGFNYRMTDIQAVLGVSQLKRVDDFVARRHYLARRYNELLRDLPVVLPYVHADAFSSWHLYVIRLKLDETRRSHHEMFEGLRSSGIYVNLHYVPVHLQPYHQRFGFKRGDFPVAEQYSREAISLPLYYGLTDESQDIVVKALKDLLE